MLKKRIIPCLDIKDGRTVKGTKFLDLKDAGDPVELAKRYVDEGADELVFLDITATLDNRKTLHKLVEEIARAINIPFTVGGGISTVEDAALLIKSGADKVSINSSAFINPNLIRDIALRFGRQCVVVAIDAKRNNGNWHVFINGGRVGSGCEVKLWAEKAVLYGAGEILLTSMDDDGTKNGFAIDLVGSLCDSISVPVIASGGAGTPEHFLNLFQRTKASAALAASVFHYNEISIPSLKSYLDINKIAIR